MKKLYYLLFLLAVFSGCSKVSPDESALSGLPNFEYQGYRYYVHPHLATYHGKFNYKDIKKSVDKLDSYGGNTWFIPSINELQEAAQVHKLTKTEGLAYISSTEAIVDKYHENYYNDHYCLLYDYSFSWEITNDPYYDFSVCPMVKYRIN